MDKKFDDAMYESAQYAKVTLDRRVNTPITALKWQISVFGWRLISVVRQGRAGVSVPYLLRDHSPHQRGG